MNTTCKCGAEWTGKRLEHCTACHHTFSGTSAGDKHRVGEHHVTEGPNRRRCLTPGEMTERGMVPNARGVWTLGGTSPWAKGDDLSCRHDSASGIDQNWGPDKVWHCDGCGVEWRDDERTPAPRFPGAQDAPGAPSSTSRDSQGGDDETRRA